MLVKGEKVGRGREGVGNTSSAWSNSSENGPTFSLTRGITLARTGFVLSAGVMKQTGKQRDFIRSTRKYGAGMLNRILHRITFFVYEADSVMLLESLFRVDIHRLQRSRVQLFN